MSILPCMQFHASYDEESYNEHNNNNNKLGT